MIETINEPDTGKWTRFFDLHSGGGRKTQFDLVIVEAPEETAIRLFTERLERDPDHVTCSCCGADFSVSEWETLTEATGIERRSGETVADFIARPNILVMRRAVDTSGTGQGGGT